MKTQMDARQRLADVDERLEPRRAREWALEQLDAMFRAGAVPDPAPEGFLPGRLLATSIAGPIDGLGRRLEHVYMPWEGKSFSSATSEGVNVLKSNAKMPMRALWPSYEPERDLADTIEAFPFRTRVEPGAVDPVVQVLKIDYDFEANPTFIIRRILDELVQVDDGLYLGKILYRLKSGYRPIGFFSLESTH